METEGCIRLVNAADWRSQVAVGEDFGVGPGGVALESNPAFFEVGCP